MIDILRMKQVSPNLHRAAAQDGRAARLSGELVAPAAATSKGNAIRTTYKRQVPSSTAPANRQAVLSGRELKGIGTLSSESVAATAAAKFPIPRKA